MEVAGEMETLKFDNVPAPGSPSALGPQLEQESGGSEEQSPGLNEARGPGGSEEQGLGVNEAREPGGSEEQGLGVNEAREPGGSEEQGLGVNEAREPGGSEMEEMEVAAQLETLKFDNMPAPGSPSALGPQLAQEPGGSEARELGGSEEQGPGVSEARELGGSEEQGPGVSEARELGGSEEQGPGVSEARELGGSEEQGPGVSEARELGGSEEQGPGVSEARELGGSEEPGNVSPPAAEAAPGAEGLQEEQPGERSTDSDSDTDSDSSSSVSSCSLSTESAESCGHQNGKDNTSYHVKKKDELPLDQELPTVEDLTIVLPEDVELKPFGTISSILEQLVIIESLKGLPAVNEESIIFKADRHAAGKVFEIFGPVLHPFYVLQFNSPEHIEAKGIHIKDTVYFAPSVEDFTQYIFTEKLKQVKGSDASWKNDQEPPPEALDFSDDEMERQAKQKKKKPQNQERKKPRSEMNESSKSNGVQNQPVQQPTSNYSRGYCGREFNPGFSRDRFPHPSVHPSFSRPQLIPPYSYSSDHRIHQESAVFPQPLRHGNPMMPQYPFPPPGFGPVGNEMHHFPPPNLNMMWTRASLLSNLYNPPFPFPPPPPPPPPPPDSSNGQFDTHKYFHD